MNKQDSELVTGIAWYRRDQWLRLREAAADADVLEDTYDEWLEIAQNTILDLAKEGIRAEPVDIDLDELIEWGRANDRPIDGKARAEFTSRKLQQRHEQTGGHSA